MFYVPYMTHYHASYTVSLPFRLISHPIFMTMLPRLQAAMTWYYLTEGQPKGPIDVPELERLFQFGAIRLGTLIWQQGMSGWTTFVEAFQPSPVTFTASKHLVPPYPITL